MRGGQRRVPRLARRSGVFTIEYLLVAVAILGVLIALLTNGGLFQTAITNITNNAQNSLSGGTNSVDAVVSGNLGAQRR